MISPELKEVILKQLNLDDFDLQDETIAPQVPGWDSLNHINIILAIEEKFGIKFKSRELIQLKCVGDLQKLVDSKLGK
ncbi:acyl carrier protein [Stygiobacter electus]|uniref:Acyl carrier protein n=1 Tax=Stygiobacter electus TaxID=3032292 RepID=A0AAE3NZ95_9BACT|nr:acyl carrier protein [Stygiobacter electus]MDF1611345.1 acyl carrier protein [Stygiobacter electus]